MFKPQFLQRLCVYGAGLSSEQRMRTAAVIFPSSNFEKIAVALALSSMFFLFPEGLQPCECWSKQEPPCLAMCGKNLQSVSLWWRLGCAAYPLSSVAPKQLWRMI